MINGVLFIVLLFCTDQWKRLVPTSLDVFPNALSTALQYLSLQLPENAGLSTYNALQLLAYFITIFIAAPLAFVTGLLQAPSIAGRFGTGAGLLNRQVARTIHFGVLVWMLVFIVMHTVMIFITGFVGNVNHITLGTNTNSWWGVVLYGAWMAVVVVFWLVASPLTIKHPRAIQKAGRFIVGRLKALLEQTNPTATYSEDDISPYFWTNGEKPESDEYHRLEAANWQNYRLRVDGVVRNPLELSYPNYSPCQARPNHPALLHPGMVGNREMVRCTDERHLRDGGAACQCEMGGLLLLRRWPRGGSVLRLHPIANMHHHQTILAYEMNGEPLNVSHGAPLRLRDEVELGFKQVKWIAAIEFVESFEHLGAGQGGNNEDQEFYGYRMPI